MKKILIIPGEVYPAHESFMAEVLSKKTRALQSVFLMRTHKYRQKMGKWNDSPVYLIPYASTFKFINTISWYFCIDIRYLFMIPFIVFKEKIDVIHVRDLTLPLFVALLLKVFFNKKVIYQKSFPIEYARLVISKKSKRKFRKIAVFSRKIENTTLHKLMGYADKVLPISHYMVENLQRDYRIPRKLMHPFGMGFNFEPLGGQLRQPPPFPPPFKIIYVGTLEGFRQFDILLEGIATFTKKSNNHNCQFTFVGGGDQEIQQLKDYADELGILAICHFTGYLSREKVYKNIGESHIGISWFGSGPQFIDASPTKMMEYLAHGIPFIAVDSVILHKDFIKDTAAGILCKIDANDFAEKTAAMIADYPECKKNAEKAIVYMKQNHSYTAMREEYTTLLNVL